MTSFSSCEGEEVNSFHISLPLGQVQSEGFKIHFFPLPSPQGFPKNLISCQEQVENKLMLT